MVGRVGKGELHERPAWARGPQQPPGPVAILDVGGVALQLERAAVGASHIAARLCAFYVLPAVIDPMLLDYGSDSI